MATNEELRPSIRPALAGRLRVRALSSPFSRHCSAPHSSQAQCCAGKRPRSSSCSRRSASPSPQRRYASSRRGHGRPAPRGRLLARPRSRLGRPPLDGFRRRRPRSPRKRGLAPHLVRLGSRHGDAGEDRAVPDGRRTAGSEDLALAARKSQPDPEGWRRRRGRLHPQRPADVGRRVHRTCPDPRRARQRRHPRGARWSVAQSGGRWFLELDLDDAKLPLPYVIDPAISHRASGSSTPDGAAGTESSRSPPASSTATS